MTTTATLQPQLFENPDFMAEHTKLMRGMMEEELVGLELGGDTDAGVFEMVEVFAVAAESLAQTLATSRGDVDPDLPDFFQETIVGRLNAPGAREPFLLDVDHGPELQDVYIIDKPAVGRLTIKACAIAEALVTEAHLHNLQFETVRRS